MGLYCDSDMGPEAEGIANEIGEGPPQSDQSTLDDDRLADPDLGIVAGITDVIDDRSE